MVLPCELLYERSTSERTDEQVLDYFHTQLISDSLFYAYFVCIVFGMYPGQTRHGRGTGSAVFILDGTSKY